MKPGNDLTENMWLELEAKNYTGAMMTFPSLPSEVFRVTIPCASQLMGYEQSPFWDDVITAGLEEQLLSEAEEELEQ